MNFNNINTQSPKIPMRHIYLFEQPELKMHEKLKVALLLFIAVHLRNTNAIFSSPEDLFQIHIIAYC